MPSFCVIKNALSSKSTKLFLCEKHAFPLLHPASGYIASDERMINTEKLV
jgi:hypothetical protein